MAGVSLCVCFMKTDRSDLRAYAMLMIVMLLWAGNTIVGRAVHEDVQPFTLAFVRWAGALALLLPFALPSLIRERAAIVRGWLPILLLGLLGIGAFNALLYTGLRETTATNALLLQAGIPALVLLLDGLLFQVRPRCWQIVGVFFSTIGVCVIVFQGDAAKAMRLHFGHGDLIILGAVVVWAFYTVLLRLRPAISSLSFVAATFAIGVATMAPLAFMELQAGEVLLASPRLIGAFIYVAIFPSLIAYSLFNTAVARIGPASAGQAITLMPLFGALLSTVLLGETLHGYHALGMALILAGIIATALHGGERRAQDSAGTRPAPPLERAP